MFMSNPPYGLWSIWKDLSVLQHLFVVILAALSIYCLFSATFVILRLRSMASLNRNQDSVSSSRAVASLHTRCANMRLLIGATFWLFGFSFFLGLQQAPRTLGHGGATVGAEILGNFVLSFAFAANVFFVFLVLHLLHWLVCSRLDSFSSHPDARLQA